MKYADVILPVPFEAFTYEVPPEMEPTVGEGFRVLVELGKSKRYAGIVLRLHNERPARDVLLKPLLQVLDPKPMATPLQVAFWQWIANYYMAPVGDVYKAAFPGLLKKESTQQTTSRNPRRQEPQWVGTDTLPDLTAAQQEAHDAICTSFERHDITLLHGVTSSGKTEIYIRLIQETLQQGRQVLYLLPEIALTTQITDRLGRVLGEQLGVYHSKFSDKERERVYRRQLSRQPYGVILGVRSSVFLPYSNLGLVIVDEEHETSYKQQEPAPRYHARSAAMMLARQFGAKVLLGTATPSLETYYHVQQGHYGYVPLMRRYADISLPDIEVVDIKRLKFQKRLHGLFSQQLLDAIHDALADGQQVILFQNRRGFSSFIECRQCGWVPRCSHCDVSLTYHKHTNSLVCHYCGKHYALPERCPCCETDQFASVGTGTERVEDQIGKLFPDARVSRMDLDTAKTRTAYQRLIDGFASHESDILIGTQMVAKGLDFDHVGVVGVLDADTMLNLPDFRSYERTFQMLSQVAGRAGRKGKKGKVILQTRSAESPIIQYVVDNDFPAMYAEQIAERKLFRYPPFVRLIYVYLRLRDNDVLEHLAQEMADLLRRSFGERVLGPDCPPVGRVQSLHIRKIVLKIEPTASTAAVRRILSAAQQHMQSLSYATNLNIYYDVDPM